MAEQKDTTFEDFINGLSKARPEIRLKIAQQLKDAGLYKGKVSDKFDVKLYNALIAASAGYKGESAFAKKFGAKVPNPIDYIQQIGFEGSDTGADGQPKTGTQTYITSPTQTARILDTVAEDLLERKLTKAEKAKYLKMINQEQRRQPAVQTVGENFTTTRGGVDEQQFLEEKIAGTAEAKTARATDAYKVMLEELGGLR
jgi:hypothetical protein